MSLHQFPKAGLAILAVLLAAFSAAATLAQSDYDRDLQATEACLRACDGMTALSPAPLTAPADLRHVDLLYQYACLTRSLFDLRETHALLARIAPSPQVPGLSAARARIALDLHCLTDARNALRACEDHFPASVQRARLAFDLAVQEGRYDEARRLAAPWGREGAHAEDISRLAWLSSFEGDVTEADALLARAESELTARDLRLFAWIVTQRGALRFQSGDRSAARSHYSRAAKAYSGWWIVERKEAELLGAEGRFAEAEALYRRLIANPYRPEIEHELGDLLTFQGKTAEAAVCYRRALASYLESANRGEAIYLHHLATLYAEGLCQPAEAVRWAHADLEARSNAFAREGLAWACFRAGDLATAEKEITAALATGVQELHVLAHAAAIFLAANRREAARSLIEKPAVGKLLVSKTFHAHF